ncbi:TIGR02186 family protein [Acidimangrovimonas sediminis]|uniref:TIGR02186 family protein n=1 Tax=Acidimangrovimonas sediminis TaxID=2056283 RepID=UPI000C7FEA69|nr:TIGR02186 family protein [Acidimangrovimonas sediminis]
MTGTIAPHPARRPALARRLILAAALGLMIVAPAASAEKLVSGVSQDQVAINATFNGSDILVYGAVARDAPLAKGVTQDVIITLEGPAQPLIVRKKARQFGIWANKESVPIDSAPSFYSVSTSVPLRQALTHTEDLRYKVSIPLAIREIGGTATAKHPQTFVNALIDIRTKAGQYEMNEDAVKFRDDTLFSTRVKLPANLTEGTYKLRIFLTQGGQVVDMSHSEITVQKTGVERWLFNLSAKQPALYGILSLFIAVAAGWLASAAFQLLRR